MKLFHTLSGNFELTRTKRWVYDVAAQETKVIQEAETSKDTVSKTIETVDVKVDTDPQKAEESFKKAAEIEKKANDNLDAAVAKATDALAKIHEKDSPIYDINSNEKFTAYKTSVQALRDTFKEKIKPLREAHDKLEAAKIGPALKNAPAITGKPSENSETKKTRADGAVLEGKFDKETGNLIKGTITHKDLQEVETGEFDKDTGHLIDGTITNKYTVLSGKFDKDTGRLIDGTRIISDTGKIEDGKFDKNTNCLIDGTVTFGGDVYKGKFDSDNYMTDGTITFKNGKTRFVGGPPPKAPPAKGAETAYKGVPVAPDKTPEVSKPTYELTADHKISITKGGKTETIEMTIPGITFTDISKEGIVTLTITDKNLLTKEAKDANKTTEKIGLYADGTFSVIDKAITEKGIVLENGKMRLGEVRENYTRETKKIDGKEVVVKKSGLKTATETGTFDGKGNLIEGERIINEGGGFLIKLNGTFGPEGNLTHGSKISCDGLARDVVYESGKFDEKGSLVEGERQLVGGGIQIGTFDKENVLTKGKTWKNISDVSPIATPVGYAGTETPTKGLTRNLLPEPWAADFTNPPNVDPDLLDKTPPDQIKDEEVIGKAKIETKPEELDDATFEPGNSDKTPADSKSVQHNKAIIEATRPGNGLEKSTIGWKGGTDGTSYRKEVVDNTTFLDNAAKSLKSIMDSKNITIYLGGTELLENPYKPYILDYIKPGADKQKVIKEHPDLFLRGSGIFDLAVAYQRACNIATKSGATIDDKTPILLELGKTDMKKDNAAAKKERKGRIWVKPASETPAPAPTPGPAPAGAPAATPSSAAPAAPSSGKESVSSALKERDEATSKALSEELAKAKATMLGLMDELNSLKNTNRLVSNSTVESKVAEKKAQIEKTFAEVNGLLTAAEAASKNGNYEEAVSKYNAAAAVLDKSLAEAQQSDSTEHALSSKSQEVIAKMRKYVEDEAPVVRQKFADKKKAAEDLKVAKATPALAPSAPKAEAAREMLADSNQRNELENNLSAVITDWENIFGKGKDTPINHSGLEPTRVYLAAIQKKEANGDYSNKLKLTEVTDWNKKFDQDIHEAYANTLKSYIAKWDECIGKGNKDSIGEPGKGHDKAHWESVLATLDQHLSISNVGTFSKRIRAEMEKKAPATS